MLHNVLGWGIKDLYLSLIFPFVQIDIVDNIPTVKFAYIHWQGERVKPMMKARATTHKGAVEEAFGVSYAP